MRRTALHWACQGGHVRIVELLVDNGANTQVRNLLKFTPQPLSKHLIATISKGAVSTKLSFKESEND